MKVISLDTNYNNKLLCDTFLHITVPPVGQVTERSLLDPISISVTDNPTLKIEVLLMDIVRLGIDQLRDRDTLLSHNMSLRSFLDWWERKYPGRSTAAIYFYKRIK